MMRRLLLLGLLAYGSFAHGAWTKTNDKFGEGTTASVGATAFSAALTNPSLIVVGVVAINTATITCSDTAGNTYVDAGQGGGLFHSSAYKVQMFYALNTSTTSSNVVTCGNGSATWKGVTALEWTGGATSSPVDAYGKSANNSYSASPHTTGNITTATNGDLVIGMIGVDSGAVSAGSGYTASASDTYKGLEYQIQNTAGSIAATWTNITGANFVALITAFKPYSGGSGVRRRVQVNQ